MPITAGAEIVSLSEERFKEIAYITTGAAFSLHDQYGSLFAEKL